MPFEGSLSSIGMYIRIISSDPACVMYLKKRNNFRRSVR